MVDDMEYECPECGAPLLADAKICNSCKTTFDMEADEESVDELLEEMTQPAETEEVGEAEEAEDAETEPSYDPSPEMVETSASYEAMDVAEDEAPMADVPEDEAPMADEPEDESLFDLREPVVKKKKALSMMGMVFVVLAVVSVIGLMMVLNYDTWINGDAENNIGDTQVMYLYLAVVGVIACIMLIVVDFVRYRATA